MKIETKDQILNTTVKLLSSSKDPESITVRDIAEAAGVQLGMINYYFHSKDKLLYQAVIILWNKIAKDWLAINDKEKSAYMRFREMLISLCGMSIKYSKYMRLIIEYGLTKKEIIAPQKTLPLIREICGDKRSEISMRIIAYEIVSTLQLFFLRADDISEYLGFDVLDHDRMVEIIDTVLANHFPEYKNETKGC